MSAYDDLSQGERDNLLNMAELTDSTWAEILAELARRDAIVRAAGAPKGSPGAGAVDDPRLLTAPDVAAVLKVPKARVYEMRRRGLIGSVRDAGRLKFTRAQVDAFVASRSVAAKAG